MKSTTIALLALLVMGVLNNISSILDRRSDTIHRRNGLSELEYRYISVDGCEYLYMGPEYRYGQGLTKLDCDCVPQKSAQ